jgi:hypothetical protein
VQRAQQRIRDRFSQSGIALAAGTLDRPVEREAEREAFADTIRRAMRRS